MPFFNLLQLIFGAFLRPQCFLFKPATVRWWPWPCGPVEENLDNGRLSRSWFSMVHLTFCKLVSVFDLAVVSYRSESWRQLYVFFFCGFCMVIQGWVPTMTATIPSNRYSFSNNSWKWKKQPCWRLNSFEGGRVCFSFPWLLDNIFPAKNNIENDFLFLKLGYVSKTHVYHKIRGKRGPRFGVHSLGPVGGFLESQLLSTNPNFSECLFDLQRRPEWSNPNDEKISTRDKKIQRAEARGERLMP